MLLSDGVDTPGHLWGAARQARLLRRQSTKRGPRRLNSACCVGTLHPKQSSKSGKSQQGGRAHGFELVLALEGCVAPGKVLCISELGCSMGTQADSPHCCKCGDPRKKYKHRDDRFSQVVKCYLVSLNRAHPLIQVHTGRYAMLQSEQGQTQRNHCFYQNALKCTHRAAIVPWVPRRMQRSTSLRCLVFSKHLLCQGRDGCSVREGATGMPMARRPCFLELSRQTQFFLVAVSL